MQPPVACEPTLARTRPSGFGWYLTDLRIAISRPGGMPVFPKGSLIRGSASPSQCANICSTYRTYSRGGGARKNNDPTRPEPPPRMASLASMSRHTDNAGVQLVAAPLRRLIHKLMPDKAARRRFEGRTSPFAFNSHAGQAARPTSRTSTACAGKETHAHPSISRVGHLANGVFVGSHNVGSIEFHHENSEPHAPQAPAGPAARGPVMVRQRRPSVNIGSEKLPFVNNRNLARQSVVFRVHAGAQAPSRPSRRAKLQQPAHTLCLVSRCGNGLPDNARVRWLAVAGYTPARLRF